MFLFDEQYTYLKKNLDPVIMILQYKVKKKKIAKVKKSLEEFLDSIKKNEPGTTSYEVFQEKNEPTAFVHMMYFIDKNAQKIHSKSNHTKKWIKELQSVCKDGPTSLNLVPVRSKKVPTSIKKPVESNPSSE